VYTTDLDGDGDVDILGAAFGADAVTWWEQGRPKRVIFFPIVLKNVGPPLPPVLDDIYNPGGHYRYTVSWSAVSRAASYTLEQDDNDVFSSPDIAYSGPNTSTSIYVGDVGTYYYRVKALNEFGSSDWSNVKSVVVIIQPTGPEPGHYTGSTPSVSFDVTIDQQVCNFDITVRFGSGYCRIRPGSCAEIADNDFSFSQSEFGAIYVINGTFDTRTHAEGDYRVSMCGGGIVIPVPEGTWDASKTSPPPASPPVLDDISNLDGDDDYTVSWSTVERATSCILQEDDNPDFSSPTPSIRDRTRPR
jgi:hypothetical protein